jgi:hypothetical protein
MARNLSPGTPSSGCLMSVCLSSSPTLAGPTQGGATSGRSSDISFLQRDLMKKTTPSPMNPRSTLEQSPFSHYSARSSSYTEQNNSASQLQASFLFCHTQRNGTEASVVAPGSLHDPRYHGKLSCPMYVLVLTCKSQDPTTRPSCAQSSACQIISYIYTVLRIHIHISL